VLLAAPLLVEPPAVPLLTDVLSAEVLSAEVLPAGVLLVEPPTVRVPAEPLAAAALPAEPLAVPLADGALPADVSAEVLLAAPLLVEPPAVPLLTDVLSAGVLLAGVLPAEPPLVPSLASLGGPLLVRLVVLGFASLLVLLGGPLLAVLNGALVVRLGAAWLDSEGVPLAVRGVALVVAVVVAPSRSYERARRAAAPGAESTASSKGMRASMPEGAVDMALSVRLNVDMKSSADSMSIGDIAAHFGLATHVLRHWESVGLLAPSRVAGERRRYGRGDLYRVAMILLAKEGGFALDDIREMLTTADVTERRAALVRQRTELVRRIAEAQASLDLIDCALGCDHEDLAECVHFQTVVAERAGLTPPRPAAERHQNPVGEEGP
jgi:MerR family copper efflux transcriptional regulator